VRNCKRQIEASARALVYVIKNKRKQNELLICKWNYADLGRTTSDSSRNRAKTGASQAMEIPVEPKQSANCENILAQRCATSSPDSAFRSDLISISGPQTFTWISDFTSIHSFEPSHFFCFYFLQLNTETTGKRGRISLSARGNYSCMD